MLNRLALLTALVLAGPALAQDHAHMSHGGAGPSEPGQGAFAAIAEIVALLESDPHTDWIKVDIAALRAHLVDMDRLVTDTEVVERALPDGVEMTITRTDAAARMVPAHAPMLQSATGWTSVLETRPDRLVWTVTSGQDGARIRALGFFGLMATGDHHRAHHLALAKGAPAH